MLLSGALLALFFSGFWLYCLTDAMQTPPAQCRGMSKRTWIAVIIGTFIGGAGAWLVLRPPDRGSSRSPGSREAGRGPDRPGGPHGPPGVPGASGPGGPRGWGDPRHLWDECWTDADDAVARHPAGRARAAEAGPAVPRGPEDDPEFLRSLARAIRGNTQAGGEA